MGNHLHSYKCGKHLHSYKCGKHLHSYKCGKHLHSYKCYNIKIYSIDQYESLSPMNTPYFKQPRGVMNSIYHNIIPLTAIQTN